MRKLYFVIPTAYLVVSILLLAHYIVTQRQTSYEWGELLLKIEGEKTTLSSTSSALPPDGIEAERIEVRFDKIRFLFDSQRGIEWEEHPFFFTRVYPSGKNGFSVLFEQKESQELFSHVPTGGVHSVIVTFQTNEIFEKELIVSLRFEGSGKVVVPVATKFGVRARPREGVTKNIRNLHVSSFRRDKIFTIVGDGEFFRQAGVWEIRSFSPYLVMRYGEERPHNLSVEKAKIREIANEVKKQGKKAIQDYVQKMYVGLTRTRYDDTRGMWLQPEGVYGFSEDALAALFAEAARRGELPHYKLFLDRAAHVHDEIRTWKTATILTESSAFVSRIMAQGEDERGRVDIAIREKHYAVLRDLRLFEKCAAFFTTKTHGELVRFVRQMPAHVIDVEIAISLLVQQKRMKWTGVHDAVAGMEDVLYQIVLDAIVVANDGYMIWREGSGIDVRLTLLAGKYLARYATTNTFRNLGYRMIITALHLSNEMGFLPRMYLVRNGIAQTMGFLSPEEIYPFLEEPAYYPRIFVRETFSEKIKEEEGISPVHIAALSTADVQFLQQDNFMKAIVDVIRSGTTQYVYLVKIKRPTRIDAFGTTWAEKHPIYEVSQGVYHDEDREVAVAKIRSSEKREIVNLVY